MTAAKLPTDEVQRRLAITERRRNLLVDAGAGTGKTRLVVDRLIEMAAPTDDGSAYPLAKIAAITFTRRAAGELRLRIREGLFSRLNESALSPTRRDRLLTALSALDTAFIGTIHSFADRLLRLSPVEAELSPSYQIVEDEEDVVREAYLELLQSAQAGTLANRFVGTPLAERALEVEETIVAALDAQLRAQTEEGDAYAKVGLDWFVREMLQRRDCPPDEPPSARFDDGSFRRAAAEYLELVRTLPAETKGERWMHRFAERVREVEASRDPKTLFELVHRIDAAVKGDSALKDTIHFEKGPSREAWGSFRAGLAEALTRPIRRWMACRLVRIRPVVEATYEEAKRRRRNVDSVDLLLKLANLMRRDLRVRASYQELFDHIFVDEFQDTDPLQAEIILFLAERPATAKSWSDVVVGEGRLTLVGDPKQSIYRFRRADVAMYEAIHAQVAKHEGTRSISLSNNFRSVPGLVDWYNDRFSRVLGTSPDRALDGQTGRVFYKPLAPFRTSIDSSAVHVLPLSLPSDAPSASDVRAVEGEGIAQYVRWLVERSGIDIKDPHTEERRLLQYRDVAVLAVVTTQLQSLFAACDALSVPYTASGGTLFLRDAIHRQFILGLRALADREDGVAEAALFRPPFFAIDLWDVLQSRAVEGAEPDRAAAERGRAARDLIDTLRRERFNHSPGVTARRLLDETAFGRLVALGPNGEQRIRHLRELCMALDHRAAEDFLDFDRVTELARSWVDWPVQLDAPRPVWSDAIQVMSVHQSKGLEFPVVVLWDSCGTWKAADRAPIFVVDPSRRAAWSLHIHGLKWEEPAGSDLLERAQAQADSERRRVVYVAATRAQEILVLPDARPRKFRDEEKYIHTMLASGGAKGVHVVERYDRESPPSWVVPRSSLGAPITAAATDEEARRQWAAASAKAKASRWCPVGVAAQAKEEVVRRLGEAEAGANAQAPGCPEGRYGAVFGETVHRAIGLALTRRLAPMDAVDRSARVTGLTEHMTEAGADVARALEALANAGISSSPTIRLEYPVGAANGGQLLTGYVDLVAIVDGRMVVVDFKTDRAPEATARHSHPHYIGQVEAYMRLLAAAGEAGSVAPRGGLLWTETGTLEWL